MLLVNYLHGVEAPEVASGKQLDAAEDVEVKDSEARVVGKGGYRQAKDYWVGERLKNGKNRF